ncbi:MAG TPA: STAS domain-containing protein [Chthoniobacterales bacterium]|jgi:anti-sigma B factor antagonist|nr:STAS domain-containing protein [Chthoniobacterales bacterium]
MKLHESSQRGVDIFELEDEIDLHYAPALRAMFRTKTRQRCPALVVDLSRVPFIDSTGISVFLEYLRDTADFGGRFCLAAPTDHVSHVFEIIRLHASLPIFDDTDQAIAAMENGAVPVPPQPLFDTTTPARRRKNFEPFSSARAA